MIYKCICGKEYDNPQSFNAHKSSCKVHLESKGRWDIRKAIYARNGETTRLRNKELRQQRREDAEAAWNSVDHFCEYCGKKFYKKLGSGRFCSEACRHAYSAKTVSEESREVVSDKLKQFYRYKYESAPHICAFCKKPIPYELRTNKYCSEDCRIAARPAKKLKEQKPKTKKSKGEKKSSAAYKLHPVKDISPKKHNGHVVSPEARARISATMKKRHRGGYRPGSGRGKKGWYKGFYCDSTYELAYVIYNIDHNIPFERCTLSYQYEWEGEFHQYHPDFILPDGSLVEIKGYLTDVVRAKLAAVTDRPIKLLMAKELQEIFTYVSETYNTSKFEELYETNYGA